MKHLLLPVLGALAAGPALAQSSGHRADFVTTLGRDTVALETFTRSAARLDGEIVLRVPGTTHFTYRVELAADGRITRSTFDVKPLSSPTFAPHKVTLEFEKDFVRVTVDSAGQTRRALPPATAATTTFLTTGFGSTLGLYASLGLYQLAVDRLSTATGDTLLIAGIGAVTGRPVTKRFLRRSDRLVDVDYFRIAWIHLGLDTEGRIEHADATETTEKTVSRRSGPLDLSRAAKDFAARDKAGRGVGLASPPDSATARLGEASIAIDYHSPRRRGREILGKVVPIGRIWRTGADAATVLSVDKPITIGEKAVPAGRYSLWTLPGPEGAELIINRQYGQWGTEYHPDRDLVRIPMHVSTVGTPRENFTIEVSGEGSAGQLRILWDTFVWSVAISAR
jgi:hypothetical protein